MMDKSLLPFVLVGVALLIGLIVFRFAWRFANRARDENERVREYQRNMPPEADAPKDASEEE